MLVKDEEKTVSMNRRFRSIIGNSKIGEGIYLLYFALMIGSRAIGLYEGMFIYNLSLVLGLLLFICKIIVTDHTYKEYGIILFLLVISGIVYLHTGEKGLIVCFATMLGMKGVSVIKTIHIGVIVAGIIILLKIFAGIIGLTSEIYYPQERAGVGVMFRHSLGYAHPNTLHMNVLMLSMLIIYFFSVLLKEKSKQNVILLAIMSLIVFLFNLYIFQYSGSRSGVLTCFVFISINFWLYIRKEIGLIEKIVVYMAFPAVSFIAIVLPLIVSNRVFAILDTTVFHSRFGLARYFWSNNNVSLWGIRLNNPNPGAERYGIDMAQLYLFLQLGIVAFLVISIITIWFIYECIKHDKRAELAVMMGMLFLGMWEPLLYNLGFKNFVYVFMGAILFGVLNDDMGAFEISDHCNPFFQKFDLIINNVDIIKRLLEILAFSIIVGAMSALIYLGITVKPVALYGDREQNESGQSFGMEPLYFSFEQVRELEANGDIVIGYVDETVPMYKYDENIARMEYDKRVLSAGVWSGLLIAVVGASVLIIVKSKKEQK